MDFYQTVVNKIKVLFDINSTFFQRWNFKFESIREICVYYLLNCINFKSLPMKKILQLIGISAVIGLLYFGFTTYPKLDLISGFSAKSIASGHFIDHRSQELIEQGDNDINLIDLAQNTIVQ